MTHPNGRIQTPAPVAVAQPAAALSYTLSALHRRFGDGCLVRLGDSAIPHTEAISTGIPALDAALGVGGLPRGRIIDIYGPESSGKTYICLRTIAQAQRQRLPCLFIDTEQNLDLTYFQACGVDIDRLYISQPETAEKGLEIAEAMIRAGVAVVVIDSAAGLVPRTEVEGENGDNCTSYGSLMSQAMRKLAGPVQQNNTVLIFTNQLRKNSQVLFGPIDTPTGGRALRHYASVQIALHRLGPVRELRDVIGYRIRATIKKNKVAPPFRSAEFELRWV